MTLAPTGRSIDSYRPIVNLGSLQIGNPPNCTSPSAVQLWPAGAAGEQGGSLDSSGSLSLEASGCALTVGRPNVDTPVVRFNPGSVGTASGGHVALLKSVSLFGGSWSVSGTGTGLWVGQASGITDAPATVTASAGATFAFSLASAHLTGAVSGAGTFCADTSNIELANASALAGISLVNLADCGPPGAGAGALTIPVGTAATVQRLRTEAASILAGGGTLTVAGDGDPATEDLSIGGFPGGGLRIVDATLVLAHGATTAQVQASTTADLAGALDVATVAAFSATTTPFDLVLAPAVNGTFTTFTATPLTNGSWQPVDSPGKASVVASFSAPPPTLAFLTVTPVDAAVPAGSTQQFNATGTLSDGSVRDVTAQVQWMVSGAGVVARISTGGLFTAVAAGTATVTATSGALSASASVTVTPPPLQSIALTPSAATVQAGSTQEFTATGTFSDGSTADLSGKVAWSASPGSVGTISSAGLVTAVAPGSLTVTAAQGAISASAQLTVTAKSPGPGRSRTSRAFKVSTPTAPVSSRMTSGMRRSAARAGRRAQGRSPCAANVRRTSGARARSRGPAPGGSAAVEPARRERRCPAARRLLCRLADLAAEPPSPATGETMRKTLALAALALTALALTPSPARAEWGLRMGLEAPLATHFDGGSYTAGDTLQPALDLLLLKGPSDFIALGAELKVGFASTASYARTGTTIGPALTLNLPAIPIYLRAALPIKVEPEGLAIGLRLAIGLKLTLPVVGFYLELTGDTPLAGQDSHGASPGFLTTQTLGAGLGLELRFF